MSTDDPDLGLPATWQCGLQLKRNAEGTYAGKAELRHGREIVCVFVIAQQPTKEAALSRLKFRAEHFISEWETRKTIKDNN